MIAFNACAAADLPLNDAPLKEDITTPEERLQMKIKLLRQEVEEGEEDLENYINFYLTAYNAFFASLRNGSRCSTARILIKYKFCVISLASGRKRRKRRDLTQ